MNIVYETNCISSNMETLNNLMKGQRKASYKKLKKLIKKAYPELYFELALDFYNPYHEETAKTKTHYILVHSKVEYFFLKIN